MAPEQSWTVEAANAALPRVAARIERIQALLVRAAEARQGGERLAGGNGHAPAAAADAELVAAVEALEAEGIVLRDAGAGLVDFPARTADGRTYLLCWVLGEPEVGWWHWPESGFAGRRPLSEPPG